MNIRSGKPKEELAHDRAMVDYIMSYGEYKINGWFKALRQNTDAEMLKAADKAWDFGLSLPNEDYYIPERTRALDVRGTGKDCDQEFIKQFGAGSLFSKEKATTH